MTDIVKRLRSPKVFITQGQMISPVAYEAADEIERLRAAIHKLLECPVLADGERFPCSIVGVQPPDTVIHKSRDRGVHPFKTFYDRVGEDSIDGILPSPDAGS